MGILSLVPFAMVGRRTLRKKHKVIAVVPIVDPEKFADVIYGCLFAWFKLSIYV